MWVSVEDDVATMYMHASSTSSMSDEENNDFEWCRCDNLEARMKFLQLLDHPPRRDQPPPHLCLGSDRARTHPSSLSSLFTYNTTKLTALPLSSLTSPILTTPMSSPTSRSGVGREKVGGDALGVRDDDWGVEKVEEESLMIQCSFPQQFIFNRMNIYFKIKYYSNSAQNDAPNRYRGK